MKKHHGWIFLGAAALLWYANQNTPAGAAAGTVPSWQLSLNTIDNYPATLVPSAPTLDIMLAAIGVFFLVKGE